MKEIKMVLIGFLMVCLLGTASADMYEADITTYRPDDISDLENTTWSAYETFVLGQDESETSIHKIKILDVSFGTGTIFIEVIKDGERFTDFVIIGEKIIIDEDFMVGLNDIDTYDGESGVVDNNDNVVKVWISPNSNDELGLVEGGSNTYNPIEYGKMNGWSSTGSTDEVTLNVERIVNADILVKIEDGKWEEQDLNSNDKRVFKLEENAEYTITVEYVKKDVWGGESDETEVYMLTVSGLEASSSGGSSVSNILLGDYQGTESNYIAVQTGVFGTFEEFSGATFTENGVNSDGNYLWNVKFDGAGSKRVTFNGDDGSNGYFTFQVSASPSEESTPVNVNQNVTNEGGNRNVWILAVLAIVLIIVGAVMFDKKKKRGSSREHSDEQLV